MAAAVLIGTPLGAPLRASFGTTMTIALVLRAGAVIPEPEQPRNLALATMAMTGGFLGPAGVGRAFPPSGIRLVPVAAAEMTVARRNLAAMTVRALDDRAPLVASIIVSVPVVVVV